jgi:hypothetical protein
MGSKMICPLCFEIGYLTKERNRYFRIIHNFKKDNKWKTRHCYIGSPQNSIEKLKKILEIHPGLNKDLDFMNAMKIIQTEIQNEKVNPQIVKSLQELRKLSKNLGEVKTSKEYESRRKDNCPHCGNPIAIWTKRTGSPAPRAYNDIWLDTYPTY